MIAAPGCPRGTANRDGLASTSRQSGSPASAARPAARPRRGAAVVAAAARRNADLVRSLARQFRNESLPWMSDLVQPLLGVGDSNAALGLPPTVPPEQLADEDSRFADVDGVRVHYKERAGARPGAPTILLLHGFNASTFSWRTSMDEASAATGCRVVAFDRPPFGLTQRPLEWGRPGQALQYNPYELEGSVTLLEGLLAQLGIGRVVLVGHSAGALVAMALQQRRPGAVAGLVLVAPAVPTTPEHAFARRATLGAQLRLALTRAVLQSDAAGLAFVRRQLLRRRDEVAAGKLGFTPQAQAAADAPGDTAAQVPEEIIEGYLRPLKAVDWDRAALLNLRAFSLPPSFDYASVAAPVLVVQGAHDGGLTRNADALVGLLRQRPHGAVTEFVALECGHVPMDELPDAFNAALAAFVRRHALPGGGGEQAAAGQ